MQNRRDFFTNQRAHLPFPPPGPNLGLPSPPPPPRLSGFGQRHNGISPLQPLRQPGGFEPLRFTQPGNSQGLRYQARDTVQLSGLPVDHLLPGRLSPHISRSRNVQVPIQDSTDARHGRSTVGLDSRLDRDIFSSRDRGLSQIYGKDISRNIPGESGVDDSGASASGVNTILHRLSGMQGSRESANLNFDRDSNVNLITAIRDIMTAHNTITDARMTAAADNTPREQYSSSQCLSEGLANIQSHQPAHSKNIKKSNAKDRLDGSSDDDTDLRQNISLSQIYDPELADSEDDGSNPPRNVDIIDNQPHVGVRESAPFHRLGSKDDDLRYGSELVKNLPQSPRRLSKTLGQLEFRDKADRTHSGMRRSDRNERISDNRRKEDQKNEYGKNSRKSQREDDRYFDSARDKRDIHSEGKNKQLSSRFSVSPFSSADPRFDSRDDTQSSKYSRSPKIFSSSNNHYPESTTFSSKSSKLVHGKSISTNVISRNDQDISKHEYETANEIVSKSRTSYQRDDHYISKSGPQKRVARYPDCVSNKSTVHLRRLSPLPSYPHKRSITPSKHNRTFSPHRGRSPLHPVRKRPLSPLSGRSRSPNLARSPYSRRSKSLIKSSKSPHRRLRSPPSRLSKSPFSKRNRSPSYLRKSPLSRRNRSPLSRLSRSPIPLRSRSSLPRLSRSSLPRRSRSPLPRRSRSPLPRRSRSPLPRLSRSPLPRISRSPLPRLSRSPLPRISRSSLPRRSRSPQSRRNCSPLSRRNRSPLSRRNRSPLSRRSRSPLPRWSRSPLPRRSRSALRQRSRSPLSRRSRSPLSRRNRSPLPRRSRSPLPRRSLSPLATRNLSPLIQRNLSPLPRRSRSPLPWRDRSPLSRRNRSPVPRRNRSPAPRRNRSPLPRLNRLPLPRQSRSPLPRQTRSPLRFRNESPLAGRISSPPRLNRSPLPRLIMSPLNQRDRDSFDIRDRTLLPEHGSPIPSSSYMELPLTDRSPLPKEQLSPVPRHRTHLDRRSRSLTPYGQSSIFRRSFTPLLQNYTLPLSGEKSPNRRRCVSPFQRKNEASIYERASNRTVQSMRSFSPEPKYRTLDESSSLQNLSPRRSKSPFAQHSSSRRGHKERTSRHEDSRLPYDSSSYPAGSLEMIDTESVLFKPRYHEHSRRNSRSFSPTGIYGATSNRSQSLRRSQNRYDSAVSETLDLLSRPLSPYLSPRHYSPLSSRRVSSSHSSRHILSPSKSHHRARSPRKFGLSSSRKSRPSSRENRRAKRSPRHSPLPSSRRSALHRKSATKPPSVSIHDRLSTNRPSRSSDVVKKPFPVTRSPNRPDVHERLSKKPVHLRIVHENAVRDSIEALSDEAILNEFFSNVDDTGEDVSSIIDEKGPMKHRLGSSKYKFQSSQKRLNKHKFMPNRKYFSGKKFAGNKKKLADQESISESKEENEISSAHAKPSTKEETGQPVKKNYLPIVFSSKKSDDTSSVIKNTD